MQQVDIAAAFKGLSLEEKFRVYRELWHKAGAYEIITSFPLHLDLELSGVCNFSCASCFQSGLITTPLGLMDDELFTKIIDEGVEKGLCAIKLQIRGESFLHPRLFECIAYAKKRGILDTQITTNASLLTEERIQQVLHSGLDAIIFSVDSHHGSNLGKGGNTGKTYSDIESTIKSFLQARKESGQDRPWVRIQSSIPDMSSGPFQQAKQYLAENFPDADVNVVSRIHNFRDDTDAYPDLHENYELQPCSYLMQRLAIFWNGQTTACCSDYNNRFQLGDAAIQTIEEIWHTEKISKFRALHLENRRKEMPICRHCVACIRSKNDGVIQDRTKGHIAD